MRKLAFMAALAAGYPLHSVGAPLNDTGMTQCFDGSSLVTCNAASTGDATGGPRQDGRYGRDAQAVAGVLSKTGGGAGGFDFTPLAANGAEILPGDPTEPSCIRDNHTSLLWEAKTNDGGLRDVDWRYSWYDGATGNPDEGNNCSNTSRCDTQKYVQDVNAANLCGYPTGWRLPTRRELLSIVHHGSSNPSIDGSYFPNTAYALAGYWTNDLNAIAPGQARAVFFSDGKSGSQAYSNQYAVRLVRSLP
ncbi:hypothetical protein ANRL1_03964 [Anaerolineae bacterium]|nr:hypothetical protein ANRL1_03964 [Anaerolineae bacterium]